MLAPVVASLLVLPFVVLEFVNRQGSQFPFSLSGFMWLLAFAFVMLPRPWIVTPVRHERKSEDSSRTWLGWQ